LSWRGDWTGEHNKSYLSVSGIFNIRELGDGLDRFDFKRLGASPNFSYVRSEGATTQDIWDDFQLYLHISGQWSDSPLISNEEFSVGGSETVRGYYESETLGDFGIASQFEARTPALLRHFGPLDELRVLAFYDEGYSGIHDPLTDQNNHYWLASTGGGLRLKLFNHLNGSLDTGIPLREGPSSHSRVAFFRFRVWGEF
jgi:hemolysin activation/secretion protein